MARPILSSLLAAVLAVSGAQALAAGDSHSHAAGHAELQLDHGKKWPTDEPLRRGMTNIRALMAEALPKAHANRLDAAGYSTLSGKVMAEIDQVTAACKLPPEADAQLHLVLAEIIDGADQMSKGAAPRDGVVKVAAAMDAYGRHFAHPGWKRLKH